MVKEGKAISLRNFNFFSTYVREEANVEFQVQFH